MGRLKIILPFFVFLLSFGVYIYTLNPSISAADSNEIVTTSIVLGIPHQPSYPVSTIIGHLFSKIPLGTLPWRVNLMSAFFQALTVTAVYLVIVKLFNLALATGQNLVERDESQKSNFHNSSFMIHNSYYLLSACAALFLAFSLEFWQFATRAEVFALNNFYGAALTLILVSWWEKIEKLKIKSEKLKVEEDEGLLRGQTSLKSIPVKGSIPQENVSRKVLQKYSFIASHMPQEARRRWSAWQPWVVGRKLKSQGPSLRLLYLFAFVSGLAFTHHQTVVLLGPAWLFLLLVIGTGFWWKKGVLAKLVLLFILGALPYFSLIPMARQSPPIQWGDPSNLKGVFRALSRSDYGTFSPYAQNPSEIEGTAPKETPISQQTYYLKSLNRDFTFPGIILAFLGAIYLSRRKRKIFLFLFLAFFFSGPFFLGFANYNLDSGFHQAVAKRFQMLPDIIFTLFLAFGLFFLWQTFVNLKLDLRENKNYLTGILLAGILSVLFVYPLSRSFKDADNRNNHLTFDYARDSLWPTPKNAFILISGDVTTFSFEYWETLVEPDNNRIIFSPGLLYLDWYVNRLKKNHPEIIIPATKSGRIQPSTTEVIDANWENLRKTGRPVYISPELARYDPQVEEKYVLWPKHLLFLVKQKGEDLKLEPYREENEAFWKSHDLKLMEQIRKNNPLLEYATVPEYARHHFNIGAVFESVHLYDDAIREYERALQIHPAFPDPYKNLGRVYGFKLKEKDYQKAWNYFGTFLQTALPSQQEDVLAVQGAMAQLQEDAMREATRSASPSAELEASPSAEASGSVKVATSSAESTESGAKN